MSGMFRREDQNENSLHPARHVTAGGTGRCARGKSAKSRRPDQCHQRKPKNVAHALGLALISDSNQLDASSREIIRRLHDTEARDVVLVDTNKLVLADAVPANLGQVFVEDPHGERLPPPSGDGKTRAFVEISHDYPDGIRQIVAQVQSESGQVLGAVILEYTPLYNELTQLTKKTTEQIALAAFGSMALAVLIAFFMGRSIAAPLQQLTDVATAFAAGKTDLPMPPPRADEIGDLTRAFENMLQKREQAEEALRRTRDELEVRVVERTAELAKTNSALQMENAERRQAEQELMWKTAFLEAQVNASIDGILVVDEQGRTQLQNQRMVDLWKMPQHIADEKGDENRLRWVTSMVKHPGPFAEKVGYLYSHPGEVSRDEIELANGTVLDRYSSPVVGQDGKYYGRIWTFRDITERKQTEESLRLLGSAVEQARESIVITDAELDLPGPKIIFINSAFTKMTGYNEAEAIGKNPRILQGPRTDKTVLGRLRHDLEGGKVFEGETINYRKNGEEFHLAWQIAPIRDVEGRVTHFVAIQRDITARKRLETQLFQSQKMETVGKLAGGIAHEFNSIMTAIIGRSELLIEDLTPGNPLAKNAVEIRKAAERAAVLTRQLLAFGRKQILQPEILDLKTVVTGMENTLIHLLGLNVEVQFRFAAGIKPVKADLGQIEQVIVNVAMNAADAMPNGGKLTIETANVTLDVDYTSRFPELKAGEFVMLAIGDTGAGMSDEVKARVFEPFFTTKGTGQGTGLGLATCHGIIKQSGGHIAIYSELGRGTTVKIYLPQVELKTETKPPVPSRTSLELPRGTETILLVEDDPSLRDMAATLLGRWGYTVLAAANGVEAMTLVHQPGRGHIDLLFTDVVMPQMNGNELADRVRALHPHTKILFTSAYTESTIVHQGVLRPGVALLQKPFTPSALAHKVRETLNL